LQFVEPPCRDEIAGVGLSIRSVSRRLASAGKTEQESARTAEKNGTLGLRYPAIRSTFERKTLRQTKIGETSGDAQASLQRRPPKGAQDVLKGEKTEVVPDRDYQFPQEYLAIIEADRVDDAFLLALEKLTIEQPEQLANMLLYRHARRHGAN
jgi:hypothetical protein